MRSFTERHPGWEAGAEEREEEGNCRQEEREHGQDPAKSAPRIALKSAVARVIIKERRQPRLIRM